MKTPYVGNGTFPTVKASELTRTCDRFSKLLQERLLDTGDFKQVEVDPDHFKIRLLTFADRVVEQPLDKAYKAYVKYMLERPERVVTVAVNELRKLGRKADQPDDPLSALRVMPEIWSNAQRCLNSLNLYGRPGTEKPVSLPLVGNLEVKFNDLTAGYLRPVTQITLEKIGLDPDSLFHLAIGQLNERAKGRVKFKKVAEGLFQVDAATIPFLPSLVLLTNQLRYVPVQGRPLVMLPTQDRMLVTGDRSIYGMRKLVEIGARMLSAAKQPLSGSIFCINGEDIWEADLADGDPSLMAARSSTLATEYRLQRRAMEELNRIKGKKAKVSKYAFRLRPDGTAMQSTCTWRAGIDNLICRCDQLDIKNESRSVLVSLPWELALDLFGNYWTPLGLSPERYWTRGFPVDAEIERAKDALLSWRHC